MVETTRGKEVARVTLLDFGGRSCLETLVKPSSTILDYKTAFSGLTEDILGGVSTTLEDVQKSLVEQGWRERESEQKSAGKPNKQKSGGV